MLRLPCRSRSQFTRLVVALLLAAPMSEPLAAEQRVADLAVRKPIAGEHNSATAAIMLASQAGAALNSDLLKGGGTDDTAALQAALKLAAQGEPVRLEIDGVALVTGLNVYGNTTIECVAGGGLYLKDQASRDVIRNVHRSRDSIRDEHITIRGCFLNGNRFNQLHHPPSDQNRGNQEPDGTFVSGISLLGVRDIALEHLTLWNMRSFGIGVANAEHVAMKDIRVDNGSPRYDPSRSIAAQLEQIAAYLNTDGVHLNGPIHDAVLDGATLHTGDDAIALNANDAGKDDLTVHNEMGPYVGQGPITDVVITNIVLDEPAYGIRMLSTNQRIDRIVIQNVTGTMDNRAVLISHWIPPSHTGNVGSVLISNLNLKPFHLPPPRELFARYHPSDADIAGFEQEDYPVFSLNAAIESLILQRVVIDVSDDRRLISVGREGAIQNLSADFSVRDPELQAAPLWLEAGARIERLSWALDWQGKVADVGKPPILYQGGTIQDLHWMYTPPRYVRAEVDKTDARAHSEIYRAGEINRFQKRDQYPSEWYDGADSRGHSSRKW
jgi:hypothetical protein